jgi:hypothetical protein
MEMRIEGNVIELEEELRKLGGRKKKLFRR